jgi:outer membrane receptor protein involved in Fe transport
MLKTNLLGATALQTGALILFAASPAYAAQPVTNSVPPTTVAHEPPAPPVTTNQTQPNRVIPATQANNVTSSPSDQGIVVTGSRIRRPNLESVVPVTSIQGEQFFQTGQTSVGDALNDLPQLRSTFAQQNPGLGIGIAGLNLLDLRGLGTVRTLVLVNGRRHVGSDILNNAVSVDINTIPNDLIDRVDIVTGGNSAVYGSDAIAGVVNFILKRDFDGLQVRVQGADSEDNYGANYITSAVWGKNFAGGRGNITLDAEYAHQDRVFASDIPFLRQNNTFLVVDVDPPGLPNGSDNVPDRSFFRNVSSASINPNGLVPITQSGTNPTCGVGLAQTNGGPSSTRTPGLPASATGLPYNCTFIFTPDGRLVQQTGSRVGTGIIGSIVGGNGQTGREGKTVSVLPMQDRINLNLLAHYTVSDAFEPFIEAKWNRIHTRGNNAGPSFIQGTFGQFDYRERIRLDNPFLNPADRTTLANAIIASGCNTSLTTSCNIPGIPSTSVPSPRPASLGGPPQDIGGPLTAADIAAINAGTYRFVDARNLLDAGIRDEDFVRKTYRVVVGARGTFNDDWSYEISANYGKFHQTDETFGFLDRQRFLLSLDAGQNPTTGQIQCRSQFDPAAAVPFAGSNAKLASDIAACVPYNPFGSGANNSAAVNYFSYNAHTTASMSQLDFQGFVNGDSSQLFSLQGGPIGFVLGAEYRREKANYTDDPFVESGATNGVTIGDFNPPTFTVKEAFGELNVPILKDIPFFHELTATGAARVSKYQGAIGTVWTYNAGGEWAPVRDLRFRGNYGKAVRAPNVSETGFPVVENFAPGFQDPCQPNQIGSNPNRQANCLADLGAPLLAQLQALGSITRSLPIRSGSNPDLKPEVSHSLTLGGVLQPRFIPGFSLSVDYYDIKVKNVIVSLSAQAIVNGCYDQPSLNNPLCGLFTRYRGTTTAANGDEPGQVARNSLLSAGQNFAKRVRRGIDTQIGYRARLAPKVILDTNLLWVHTLQSSNFENPSIPTFENRLLSEIGDPKDEARLDADLKVGNVTFGYRVHYIGRMINSLAAFEDFEALPSACTPGGCPPNNADFADIEWNPAVTYHDLRFQWDTGPVFMAKNVQFYVGVNNLFNKVPPLGVTGLGSGTAIYDIRGRNYYGGIKARF